MDNDTLPAIVVGACIMCGTIWYGSHLLGEVTPIEHGRSTEAVMTESAPTEQELRSPDSDLVAVHEDADRQKRQIEWDRESAIIQRRARLREDEYRARLRQYDAEDRRREIEQREARAAEELQQQLEADELAKRREEESILRRQPKQVVREVLIPDAPVPGRYVLPSQRK